MSLERKGKDNRDDSDEKEAPRAAARVPAVASVPSVPSEPAGFIPPHGGYQNLFSFQKAQIVFDATVYFCRRFLDKRDRTYDQMIQAARSGKQNIVEGSQVSGTSKEFELKLTSVARASLEELLTDYRDFLRVRKLSEWTPDHPYAQRLRKLNRTPGASYETFRRGIEHADPAICANEIIGLIKVTNFLLDRQIMALERAFLKQGGLREAMTRARLASRARQGGTYP
jgi:four helix bundle suffix protein